MNVVEGGSFTFTVVAKNKFGTVLPVTDAAVSVDNPDLGAVTVNADGTGGVFTAAVGKDGDLNLVPSAGGVQGTPFQLTVSGDTTVASVEIVPDAPATVEVQPQ
jgi:hypothetical protein